MLVKEVWYTFSLGLMFTTDVSFTFMIDVQTTDTFIAQGKESGPARPNPHTAKSMDLKIPAAISLCDPFAPRCDIVSPCLCVVNRDILC